MQRWVTVFAAPPWEAAWVRLELDRRGILAFTPDENLKVIDPFITGNDPLNTKVQVPEDAVEAAKVVIDEILACRRAGTAQEPPDGGHEGDKVWSTAALQELEQIGRRTCWACLLAAPIGWYLAYRYFKSARDLRERPPLFGLVVTALAFSSLYMTWFVVILLSGPDR